MLSVGESVAHVENGPNNVCCFSPGNCYKKEEKIVI